MIPTTQIELENLLVVKLGGGEGLNLDRCLDDLASLARQRPLVVVHGVSARMNALCEALGHPVQTLTSPSGHTSRYTDAATRDIFVQAAEQVNVTVVEGLQARGVNAIGFTGSDVILGGERKAAVRAVVNGRVRIVRDDYSGTVTGVDANRLYETLRAGAIPVLPPMALSDDGLLNVDGDRASAAVAAALDAVDLLILSNVRGLLRDVEDQESVIRTVNAAQFDRALNWAEGRMKRKVLGAQEALQGGVRRVVIADGRAETPIQQALNGAGTEFIHE